MPNIESIVTIDPESDTILAPGHSNVETTVTLLGPPGPAGPGASDADVANYVSDTGSDTYAALRAIYVAFGLRFLSVDDPQFGGNLDAMLTALAGGGTGYVPAGNYSKSTTTTIPWPCVVFGAGEGATTITYTGTGTAMQLINPGTAEQKVNVHLSDFTLVAHTAAIGINAKGMSKGQIERVKIEGPTTPVAGSIGLLWDGSYGGSIGCWWNVIRDSWIYGFENGVKSTGAVGAGQANENKVENTRIENYTGKGVWIDIGDHNTVEHCDLTSTQVGSVGVYINDSQARVLDCRFEQTDTCIEIAGSGGQHANIDKNTISSSCTTGIKIDSGAGVTADLVLGDNYNNATTKITDSTSGLTTSAQSLNRFSRGLTPYHFVLAGLIANGTNVGMKYGGGATQDSAYIGRPYQIRGVTFRYTSSITAGTITVTPGTTSGASATLSGTASSGKNGSNYQGMGKDADTGTNSIQCFVTTSSLAPTGGELTATVWIEFTS